MGVFTFGVSLEVNDEQLCTSAWNKSQQAGTQEAVTQCLTLQQATALSHNMGPVLICVRAVYPLTAASCSVTWYQRDFLGFTRCTKASVVWLFYRIIKKMCTRVKYQAFWEFQNNNGATVNTLPYTRKTRQPAFTALIMFRGPSAEAEEWSQCYINTVSGPFSFSIIDPVSEYQPGLRSVHVGRDQITGPRTSGCCSGVIS